MRNLFDFDIDYVVSLYKQHKTLTNVAKELNFNLETVRKFFIQNKIPYNKQVHYKCDESFFDSLTEKSMYWLGFFAADGSIDGKKNRMTINLAIKDLEHLQKFKNDLKLESPIKIFFKKETRKEFKKNKYEGCCIRFTSNHISNKLISYGITPNKSKTYTISNLIEDNNYFKHYIRGIIDGDGWIYCKNNHPSIGLCGTESVVSTIFNHLKIKLNFKSKTKIIKNKKGLFLFRISNVEDNKKIINYIYNNASVQLDRKFQVAQEILKLESSRKIDLNKEDMIKLHNDIKEHTKIGKILGCSNSTVKRRLIEYGVI